VEVKPFKDHQIYKNNFFPRLFGREKGENERNDVLTFLRAKEGLGDGGDKKI